MVAMHLACSFVTGQLAGYQNLSFGNPFKIVYPAACRCFLILMLYLMLDGLILFIKSDFHSVRCL